MAGTEDIDLPVVDDFARRSLSILQVFQPLPGGGGDDDLLGHTCSRFAGLSLLGAVDAELAQMANGEGDIGGVPAPEESVLAEGVGSVFADIGFSHCAFGRREVGQFIMSVASDDEGDVGYRVSGEALDAEGVIGVESQQQSCILIFIELRSADALGFVAGEAEQSVGGGEIG